MSYPGVFREAKSDEFVKKLSFAADEKVVDKIGSKMPPCTAVIFMLNSLTGLSLLTMPYGFVNCGLVLGGLIVFVCMVISYVTATFMVEALTIANALSYEAAEQQALENEGPEFRQNLHEEKLAQTREGYPAVKTPLLEQQNTIQAFQDENRVLNAAHEFKIRERVELGPMGELVLTTGRRSKATATAIYIMILCFTYGTATALVVTVNQSLSHTVASALELAGYTAPSENLTYHACVLVSFVITLPLCFANLQNTKKVTMVVMVCRFVAIAILVLVGGLKSMERVKNEGFDAVVKSIPLWKPDGFVGVFGNAIFLFGLHHYMPSMISPLEPQHRAPCVIISAFLCCFLLLIAICLTALTAWNAETDLECSARPGGHFCKIQPLYNLNFGPLSWGGGSVALFLLSYPALAISSIPIAAITTRNTMGKWLNIPPPDPDAPYTATNVALTLAVVVPPFVVASLTQDVQVVIQYVGGYAGLSVSYVCPLVVLVRCRQALRLDQPDFARIDRPLKSPFGNMCGYAIVVICYVFALVMVTKKLFF
eukprot:TRINITY_DN107295_c0_g1_i1.p1 TRINITY_DN107295_c0_g1~~TRINITY_DN107295_c0_g1_i1.p1  ORF type:complete len:551 (-),score=97.69 TRINITY_DN107295_c0_g1_i1:73-1692(-)